MGKVEEEEPAGAPEWLVTFSDLVSLLVTLFIMMLTFSTQETHDFSKAVDLVQGSFGMFKDRVRDAPDLSPSPILQENVPGGVTKFDPDQPDKELRIRELEGFVIESRELDAGIRLIPETVSGFSPGDDRPSPELVQEIRRLARMLKKHKERSFVVEGHADPSTDRNSPLGEPDLLGLARARRIGRLLGLEGLPYERITVVSKGNNKPRGDLWTESGQARNRRIEIVITKAPKGKR